MHIVFHLILIVVALAIVVQCQGARGGSRGGGSGIRVGTRTGSGCRGAHCQRTGIIAGSIVGGVFGLLAVIFAIVFCYRQWRRKSRRSNAAFVNEASASPKSQMNERDCFETGVWFSRYYQYGTWHGPHRLSLSFDRQTCTMSGQGVDDIGKFTIAGMFFPETHRMSLAKTYDQGTGNLKENLGHTVTIQLTWNSDRGQFEGKWFVQTSKYRGEDKFELKFEQPSETVMNKMND